MSLLKNIRDYIYFFFVLASIFFYEIVYKCYYRNRAMSKEEEENIVGEVVIVTGASRGMGKAVSEEFAKRGATVILGCVDIKEGEDAVNEIKMKSGNQNVHMIFLDLADMTSVQSFAAEVTRRYPKIKILVNNAGIPGGIGASQSKTKDGFNVTMAVNHLGHFLLTNLLLDSLKSGIPSRVVAISSTMQLLQQLDINDINMEKSGFGIENSFPYCNSKYAVALFMKELGHRLKGTGITTYALCPGAVNTTIFANAPALMRLPAKFLFYFFGFTAAQAATEFILYNAISKEIAHESGVMYRYKKHFAAANRNLKDNVAKELWDASANLVQLEETIARKNSDHAEKHISLTLE